MSRPSIDIFCLVIDNYGDAAVCGRFAAQWAREINPNTRLYIDNPSVLKVLIPNADELFEVILWNKDTIYNNPADIVIEGFGANLPDSFIETIKNRETPPLWIDLEYLSAEDWTHSCHAVPSTHPQTGLKKSLFFPGFGIETGGIIRENDYINRKNAFINDKNAQNKWRNANNLPEIAENTIDISLFCYKTAPKDAFLNELSTYSRPVRVFQPERRHDVSITKNGALTIYNIPFLTQTNFDNLCQTCDINFVRGEDSFVRAQLSAKPLIWNIYVQEGNVHLQKLQAFLNLYSPFFAPNMRDLLAQMHNLWNEGDHEQKYIWHELLDNLQALTIGAGNWADALYAQDHLVTRLLRFYATQIKINGKG